MFTLHVEGANCNYDYIIASVTNQIVGLTQLTIATIAHGQIVPELRSN